MSVNILLANEKSKTVYFGSVGIESGGGDVSDEIELIIYEDVDAVPLGGGVYLKFGVSTPIYKQIEGQFSFGYLFNAGTEEKKYVYLAVPFELLGFYKIKNHRFGCGGMYHCWPHVSDVQYQGNGYGGADYRSREGDLAFENSLGLVMQYDYTLRYMTGGLRLGLRYTIIDFQSKDFDKTIDGSGFGFELCILFN